MKRLICISLALLLSACSLWDNYKHPQTPAPQTWNGAQATASWPAPDWWTTFSSPRLTALVMETEAANFDLKAAEARVRQADAQLRIAGATLLPSVDATGNAERLKTAGGKVHNSVNATLNASYEIDFWGKNWSAQEAARATAQASRFDEEVVALTTLSSVADTYFGVLGAQDRLNVAQDNLKSAEDLLDAIRLRFKVGTASALDVAQQENATATVRASIPPLQLQLQQNKDALAILLGRLPEDIQPETGTLGDIATPVVTPGLPSELLTRRPDVQEAEANLIAANANIINARAQFFPNIALTGSDGYASTALGSLFKPGSSLFSLAAGVTQPIFEGGLLEGQLEFAHARYDELLQNYRKTVVAAFSDVEDSLSAVQQAAAQVEAQKEAVSTAKNAYDMSLQQLRGGIVDITTVLNTEHALFASQDALVQAQIIRLNAIVGLYKALGGGWSGKAV